MVAPFGLVVSRFFILATKIYAPLLQEGLTNDLMTESRVGSEWSRVEQSEVSSRRGVIINNNFNLLVSYDNKLKRAAASVLKEPPR
jgi:hypothetical protein